MADMNRPRELGRPGGPVGQPMKTGNGPTEFTPRRGETQEQAGARVRGCVRDVVRRNGGAPDNGE